MAKGTIIFLFILALVATLLFGINLGKKLGNNQLQTVNYPASPAGRQQPTPSLSPTPSPTLIILPAKSASPSAVMKKNSATTTYTDTTCGFSFTYSGSYIKQKSTNQQATILTDPNDPTSTIAATCAATIPRPPVSSDKIEAITLDKVAATLYHDQDAKDGSPRDEVIVKHPKTGLEIILAGFGANFQQALTSFKFIL